MHCHTLRKEIMPEIQAKPGNLNIGPSKKTGLTSVKILRCEYIPVLTWKYGQLHHLGVCTPFKYKGNRVKLRVVKKNSCHSRARFMCEI